MEQKMKINDVVNVINAKTGYYKKDIKVVLMALEEVIYENMLTATIDEPSAIKLFPGFFIGAKKIPEKLVREPQNQDIIKVEEHLNPYTRFKRSFKNKLNNYQEEYEDFDDEYDEEI